MEGTRIALALPAPPIISRKSAKAAVGSRQQTQIAADSFSQRGLLSREVSTRSLRSLLGLVLAKELAQTRSLWSLLSHGIQARSLNGACSVVGKQRLQPAAAVGSRYRQLVVSKSAMARGVSILSRESSPPPVSPGAAPARCQDSQSRR